ncbi:hypothetical protein GJ744_002369 [Endocarpon pusillum]|uniref:Uncharacterized protein n=1 Tax=Endocarpon pusillum TaxID=364733 RepID=A0A8H7AQ61_9EURO|nr:hypothetical protein GJ744_002369 [Endocarpon pusillum]
MDPRLRGASTAPFRERKFSSPSDRLHRQARQSILFEERKSPVFRDDLFSSLPLFKTQGLGRSGTAATDVSPTEVHPGKRLAEPSGRWGPDSSNGHQELSDIFPIPSPTHLKKTTVAPESAQVAHAHALDENLVEAQHDLDHAIFAARSSHLWSGFLRGLLNLFPRSATLKPGAFTGLQVASTAATAHAKAILHHQSYLHNQRQHIYITEYEVGDSLKPKRVPMTLNSISGIQHYLIEASTSRFTAPLLRVIYIQNNAEAMDFLTNIFRLDHASFEKFEGSLKDWIHEQKSHRDSSNKTISWKPMYDVTRDITCTVFGLDLGSGLVGVQAAPDIALPGNKNFDRRVLTTGLSASRPQRLSIYIQRKLDGFPEVGKMGVFNTSAREKWQCAHQNTILIYENSHDDCEEIIQGQGLLDLEWKASTTDKDSDVALVRTMEHILLHIFTKVLRAWRKQLALLSIQHAQLEDRVYGQPSDDSHATELWAMSKYLWSMAKLVNRHSNLIEDVQEHFNQFAERNNDYGWLDDILRDFRQASVTIQDDFIRPTEHMIDLMYKSVSIRDSRQSLELNASLWRLSWITFIFLPLTFLVGFFGMNVGVFEHYPSVKYYFITAIPLMTIILLLWFAVRHYVPSDGSLRLPSRRSAQLDEPERPP